MTGMSDDAIKALLDRSEWQAERRLLRGILRGEGLDETVKWGKLCYTHAGGNVAIIYGMKDCCAVGFFKGALLDDRAGRLVAPGKHSQAMRQMRFAGLDEIKADEAALRGFVKAAIEVEAEGRKIALTSPQQEPPPELTEALGRDRPFAKAFDALTPGRRRGWLLHFAGAKQAGTRAARIEKARARIIEGKGPNDRQAPTAPRTSPQ